MKPVKPTNELDTILKKAEQKDDLELYLNQENLLDGRQSFSTYFNQLEKVKKIPLAELVMASGLDRTYAYQIMAGKKNPSRDKEIALCIAAGLNEEEVSRILKMTGYSPLYAREKRDAVLIYALHQKKNVLETNVLLDEYHENILE